MPMNCQTTTVYAISCLVCTGVQRGDPVQLLPWLYLGSSWHASRRSRLVQLGITGLLNVAAVEVPTHVDVDGDGQDRCAPPPMTSMSVPIVDNCTADIASWFPECFSFIGNFVSLASICARQFCFLFVTKGSLTVKRIAIIFGDLPFGYIRYYEMVLLQVCKVKIIIWNVFLLGYLKYGPNRPTSVITNIVWLHFDLKVFLSLGLTYIVY